MTGAPRIALFADTFHEVNGAARTCREFEAFARRRGLPFLCVRWGKTPEFRIDGPVRTLELARSPFSFPLDPDLRFDLCFYRLLDRVENEVRDLRPDFIHVTSPGDLGILAAVIAARLRIPMAASWHTNLHEFAARRLRWLPARKVENFVMDRVCWFFRSAEVIFAPNPELARELHARTGRRVRPMGRGIDTDLFHPSRRSRTDSALVLGFVGRLMPEKNLRLLPRVAETLRAAGVEDFRFQITGAGSERGWLERHLRDADFTGVLTGEALARACADLDIFLFPSLTDTFGNVVQEAMASAVAPVVMNAGGPRFIVRHGRSGLVAQNDADFCHAAATLAASPRTRFEMARAGRLQVEYQSWDRVFEDVYEGYANPVEVL